MSLIEERRRLEALEDRIDLDDARKALAEVNKKKAKPLRTLMEELHLSRSQPCSQQKI